MRRSLFAVNKMWCIAILKRVAALFFLITLAMTLPLWLTTDDLPPLSVWMGISMQRPVHLVGLAMMVLWTLVILFFPRGARQGVIMLLLVAQLVLMDINRCQIWLIHYLYIFLLPEEMDEAELKVAMTWLLCLTYLLSGLHKWNAGFARETAPWLLMPFGAEKHSTIFTWAIPCMEVVMGISLLLPGMSSWASRFFIVMHSCIIYLLLYYGWNYSVIPWNGFLIAIHFANAAFSDRRFLSSVPKSWLLMFVLLTVTMLSFTGVIHPAFSFRLYSGNQYTGIIVFSEPAFKRLPTSVQSMCGSLKNTKEPFLNLDRYAIKVLGVPLFQDMPCYQWAAKRFVPYARDENDMALLIRNGPEFRFDKDLWAFTLTEINAFYAPVMNQP